MCLIQNRKNDAYATIRGFLYQIEHTLLEWINLSENEILYLEGLEDYDKVVKNIENEEKPDIAILNQIKYSEDSISLNNKKLTKYIINFIEHRKNNPDKKIKFNFLTTSNIANEKNNIEDKTGIEYWQKIFYSKSFNKEDIDVIVSILDESIINEFKIENDIDYNTFFYFIKDFNIITNYLKVDKLEDKIVSELESKGLDNCQNIYERAVYYLFKKMSQKSEKKINLIDFQSMINTPLNNKGIDLLFEIKVQVIKHEELLKNHENTLINHEERLEYNEKKMSNLENFVDISANFRKESKDYSLFNNIPKVTPEDESELEVEEERERERIKKEKTKSYKDKIKLEKKKIDDEEEKIEVAEVAINKCNGKIKTSKSNIELYRSKLKKME